MSHIKLIIDDQIVMDGDLGQWSSTPPELEPLLAQLKNNPRNAAPWTRCLMLVLAEAGMTGRSQTVIIDTGNPWSMAVDTTDKDESWSPVRQP